MSRYSCDDCSNFTLFLYFSFEGNRFNQNNLLFGSFGGRLPILLLLLLLLLFLFLLLLLLLSLWLLLLLVLHIVQWLFFVLLLIKVHSLQVHSPPSCGSI